MERRSLKRLLPSPLETCVKSGPVAPRALPRFPATMSRSDCRPTPRRGYGFPRRVPPGRGRRRLSQDPSSLCRRAPSPIAPGSPMRACARCFRIGDRLQHFRKIGRCHWCHETESGSLSLGSRLRSRRPLRRRPGGLIAQPDRSVSRRRLPFDAGPELHVERAIHMAGTSQPARGMRVDLAQPKHTKHGNARKTIGRSWARPVQRTGR
jgi:hypothetical protein